MRRLFFDRSDGKRIKPKDPIFRLIPYIMPKRYDAQIFLDDDVSLDGSEALIRQLRKDGHRVLYLHIVLAAILRTMAEFPKSNRFVAGRKLYARNKIAFCFAIKKEMTLEAEETIIKVNFKPEDTLYQVIETINSAIDKNRVISNKNSTDMAARVLNIMPGFLIRTAMFIVRRLDNHRMLPKFLISASPFHCSAFITDLGSLGIKPVYHHIYDFGTTSFFLAFGTKQRHLKLEDDQVVNKVRKMTYRVVVDERISDGYYFAQTIKAFKNYMEKPEKLLTQSNKIIVDDEIR